MNPSLLPPFPAFTLTCPAQSSIDSPLHVADWQSPRALFFLSCPFSSLPTFPFLHHSLDLPPLCCKTISPLLLLYGKERRPSLAPLQIALEVRLPHTSSFWNTVHSHLDNLRDDTQYITSWISAGWSECRTHSSYRLFITDTSPTYHRHLSS